jgi:sugar lactone lactonase YvrE
VDNNGNLYIADTGNNVIRTVSAATGAISTIGGFIVKTTDKNGVTVNTGIAGSEGDGGLAINAQFSGPQGVGVNPQGTLLCVADTGNATVRQINLATGTIITIGGITGDSSSDGNLPTSGWLSRLSGPQGCAMDSKGNTYIADTGNSRIVLVDPTGKMFLIAGGGSVFASDGKAATTAQLFAPVGIAVDGAGNVFFTDRFGLIKELTPNP